jgi:hypothetical protein
MSSGSHQGMVAVCRGGSPVVCEVAQLRWPVMVSKVASVRPCRFMEMRGCCCNTGLETGSNWRVAHRKGAVGGGAAVLRRHSGMGWPAPMAHRAAPEHRGDPGPAGEGGGRPVRVGEDDRGKENRGGWRRLYQWMTVVGEGWTKGTNKRAFL